VPPELDGVTSPITTASGQPYSTAAATMNTDASEVRPTSTPSIGSGKASVRIAAARSASEPAIVSRLGTSDDSE
jgi:hypothetical protein